MITMRDREVYPNAPLVLVALEVRHPIVGPLSAAAQAKIKRNLSTELPLRRTATMTTVQATIGAAPEVITEKAPKYLSRDLTASVTYRNEAIVVETTRYEQYERLRELADLAVQARQAVEPIDGVERVGLRYINEIRVPEGSDGQIDWAQWVDPTLLGPSLIGADLGLKAMQSQGIVVFDSGPGTALVLRYGPREGYAVDPGGDLKRRAPAPGPFFLVDIDSFWTPVDDVPEVDPKTLLSLCDDLHKPVRSLFDSLITDRLRTEVLRNA